MSAPCRHPRQEQTCSGRRTAQRAALPWEYVSLGVRQPAGSIAEAAALAAACDAAVVVGAASVSEAEGYDRENLDLPGDQNALVEAVLAANPRTVVVLTNGAPYALPWIDHAPAVVEGWLGGEAGPDAVARILIGEAEPSGRLPITFPRRLRDSPAHRFYPGGEQVAYGEGLHVGYRHFDAAGEPPLFAFGHGLTYTRFRYSDLARSPRRRGSACASARSSFTLRQHRRAAGQGNGAALCSPARASPLERPVKELEGLCQGYA